MRATAADRSPALEPSTVWLMCLAAWFIPGAGHLWLRRSQKGLVFLLLLPLMFLVGLLISGRIFPFEASEPLVLLAAFADLGIGLPYFLAWMAGAGGGTVTSATYEYGNTYIIVAGLLNMLVVLDAYDIAMGRK
jgi:hypothetical protein